MTGEQAALLTAVASTLANIAIAIVVVMGRRWAKQDAVEAVVDGMDEKMNEKFGEISIKMARIETTQATIESSVTEIKNTMKEEHGQLRKDIKDLDRRVAKLEGNAGASR